MARFRWPILSTAGVVAVLSGCSGFDHRERPVWRTEAEEACLARGLVRETADLVRAPEIDGPGICGLHHPFKVQALAEGAVTLASTATLDCSMIPALDGWIKDVLQPAALARFGEPVAEIRTMGSYNCRGINNESGASLSEHAFGNAIDIASFVLRSGRELKIARDWDSPDDQVRAFLHEAHAGSCGFFTTVLGPGSNALHANHYHLDLAMHGTNSRGLRRICRPAPDLGPAPAPPRDALPDPPAIDEDVDVSQAAPPAEPSGQAERAGMALIRRTDPPVGRNPDLSAGSGPAAPPDTPGAWDLTSSIRHRR